MQNKKTNNDVSKPEILRFLWDLIVFRLFAEYDLFKPTTFIQNFIYIDFRIILTQFYILGFFSYTPFHFSFRVPLNYTKLPKT